LKRAISWNPTVKRSLVWVILLSMPVRSVVPLRAPHQVQTSRLADNPRVRAALNWFTPNITWVNEQQARLTEIPAPPFQEERRAAAVRELLFESGLAVHVDKTGNVIGEMRGADEKEIVIFAAHLDTVFPTGTDVKVRREGSRMSAPGIADNGKIGRAHV
jgi:tripeptide aminopeptidase